MILVKNFFKFLFLKKSRIFELEIFSKIVAKYPTRKPDYPTRNPQHGWRVIPAATRNPHSNTRPDPKPANMLPDPALMCSFKQVKYFRKH